MPFQGRSGNRTWLCVTGISPLRGSLRAAPIAYSCGWTGVPTLVLSSQDRSATICFLVGWTRSPPSLPLLCNKLHRWVLALPPMSLANSLSLHGTPADVFPLLDMYLRRYMKGIYLSTTLPNFDTP